MIHDIKKRRTGVTGWDIVKLGDKHFFAKPHDRGVHVKRTMPRGGMVMDMRLNWTKIPVFSDVLVYRAAELGILVQEYDSNDELAHAIARRELCEICGGSGSIEYPAENRGGEIYGPDSEVCRTCKGSGKNPQA